MVRTDEEVDMLFTAIGRPDLLLDPRFVTADLRVEHGDVLVEEMKAALITETAAHWMQVLTDVGVPVALVGRVDDLTSDPQVIANDMAITPTPEVGMPSVINHPLNIEGLATRSAGRAPDLGEHSEAILAELGYTATDIARAKEQGVI